MFEISGPLVFRHSEEPNEVVLVLDAINFLWNIHEILERKLKKHFPSHATRTRSYTGNKPEISKAFF